MKKILRSANRNSNRDTDYEYLNLTNEDLKMIEDVLDERSKEVVKNSNPEEDLYVFFVNENNELICDSEKKEKIIPDRFAF